MTAARTGGRRAIRVLFVVVLAALGACSADQPLNPSFPLTVAEAESAYEAMEDAPRPLVRPVVLVGGFFDPGVATTRLRRRLRRVVTDRTAVTSVALFGCGDLDACVAKVERTLAALPGPPEEIDLVGISMGGIVARAVAARMDAPHVARVFTIAAPHRGARLAETLPLPGCAAQMRPGSPWLTALDGRSNGAEVLPYARLGDAIVGVDRTAPPGRHAWWVAGPTVGFAHLHAASDMRIVADIARRLRGEPAWSTEPAVPPP